VYCARRTVCEENENPLFASRLCGLFEGERILRFFCNHDSMLGGRAPDRRRQNKKNPWLSTGELSWWGRLRGKRVHQKISVSLIPPLNCHVSSGHIFPAPKKPADKAGRRGEGGLKVCTQSVFSDKKN